MTFRLTLIKTEFPLLRRSQSWYTIPDRYVSFRLSMLCCKIFTVKLCAALQVAQIFDVDRNLEVLGARLQDKTTTQKNPNEMSIYVRTAIHRQPCTSAAFLPSLNGTLGNVETVETKDTIKRLTNGF